MTDIIAPTEVIGKKRYRLIAFENVGLRYGYGPEMQGPVLSSIPIVPFRPGRPPGKTSLLRSCCFAKLRGRVDVRRGRHRSTAPVVADAPPYRHRLQEFRLLDPTTFENVVPLRVRGQSETSYRANVEELLDWVGLGDRMDAYPPLLSGGEKQRAAIARAVIAKPEILLADEPTGNVDPELSERLLHLFEELNRMGTTIILATHELALLDKFAYPRMLLNEELVIHE